MYVNIEVTVKNIGVFNPRGFYYKGEGTKTKLVIVGCEKEKHNIKKTFLLSDCEITLTKITKFGDVYSI